MADKLPPSPEVVEELFYDACAWLRDLEIDGVPEDYMQLTLRIPIPFPTDTIDPETGDVTDSRIEEWPVEISRFPDGRPMHVHGPGICVNIDDEAFYAKRPPKEPFGITFGPADEEPS